MIVLIFMSVGTVMQIGLTKYASTIILNNAAMVKVHPIAKMQHDAVPAGCKSRLPTHIQTNRKQQALTLHARRVAEENGRKDWQFSKTNGGIFQYFITFAHYTY